MKYFKLLILTLLVSMMTSSCECPTECEHDTSPPSSMIIFPIENDYVMGTVEVTCMISDDEAIMKVELWVDGIFSGLESTEEPYTFQWSTDQLEENTRHTLVARAFDINGNVADSDPVVVTVIQNPDIQVIQELMVDNYIQDDLPAFMDKYCSFTEEGGGSRIKSISIYDSMRISIIPESFGTLEKLESLELPEQAIRSLPDDFGNLNSLSDLDLSSNALVSLPESFGNLSNLCELDLSYNELESLPESFGNLSSLTELYLSYNKLEFLPESIGDLSALDLLHLTQNELTSLPESFADLAMLTSLSLLYNHLYCVDGEEDPPQWLIDFCEQFRFNGSLYSQNC